MMKISEIFTSCQGEGLVALDYRNILHGERFFEKDIWACYKQRLLSGHYEPRRTEQYLHIHKKTLDVNTRETECN